MLYELPHLTYFLLFFSQTFPDGANQTRANSPDDVICGFPGFRVDPAPARLAYLSYGTSTLEAAVGRYALGHGEALGKKNSIV